MKRLAHKRFGWMLGVLLAALLVFNVSGAQAKKITIKLTTVQMPKQQMGKGAQQLAAMVNKELGDKVEIKVYPSAQLYGGKEEIEALMRGEIQMCLPIGSQLENVDPALQLFKLPFVFPSAEVAYKVLDSDIGTALMKKVFDKNILSLGIFSSGNVLFSDSKRPLLMPEDFKGLKMRSFGRMGKDTLEALGATAVVTASEETFSALQEGVIDGMSTPNSVYLPRKYNTVQKYVTDGGMVNFTNGYLLANVNFWNGLPGDVRAPLKAIVDKFIADIRKEMDEENVKINEQIKKTGNELFILTPEQAAAWKKALQVVYTKYGPEIGEDMIRKVQDRVAALSR
jgi:C4-dicarboxylate-binding protein DctP